MSLSTDICERLYAHAREDNGRNVDIELNGTPVLLIQRHEEADQVLRVRANRYRKNMVWFRQTLGASRFSEDGEAWRIRRALTHGYFTHFDKERTWTLALRHAESAINRLMGATGSEADRIDDGVLREMTVSVLVENFLGVPFADLDLDLDHLTAMMQHGSAYSFVPVGETQARYRDTLKLLPGLRRKVLHDMQIFRNGTVPAGPLLAGMLAADADPANDVVLEHELLTFFVAGAETSAAAMGWACYLLARYPDVQERLREQVLSDPEALAAYDLLTDFLSEALRLYPPTPIIARLADASDELDGRRLEPGRNVLISLIGVGHDCRWRADPWSLNLDADARRGPGAGVNAAFSFGPRICGGKQFALVELIAFLAVFLSHARFELSSDAPPRFHWKAQMLREGMQPVRALPLCAGRRAAAVAR